MTPGILLLAESVSAGPEIRTVLGIFAGIAVFMFALRFLGLFLAATHPAKDASPERPTPRPEPARASSATDPKILAIIAATVSEVLQKPHTIVSMKKSPSVESLMQQWSMEGRRAIYSSHKFR
jgi:hypothetical protein